MMLFLHLFNRDYYGLFKPLIFIGNQPLSYYISLFCDACVPIFAFVSSYGLYFSYINNQKQFPTKNLDRTKKLYFKYWIILIFFAVILGLFLYKEGYPGNWIKFLLNFTAISTSYNGAWWFFTIYILFVFTCVFWFNLLEVLNRYVYFGILLFVYFLAFYFRIYKTEIFTNYILQWFHVQGSLYFCTLFQFMLGAFALKYQWHKKFSVLFYKLRSKNTIAILGIVLLIVIHGLIPNYVVAPFTGLGFIFLFLQIGLTKKAQKLLDFFTPHSTNIWLIHMFFYLIYFKEIIYAPQYPLLIFGWLVFLFLISSFLINFIYNKLENTVL